MMITVAYTVEREIGKRGVKFELALLLEFTTFHVVFVFFTSAQVMQPFLFI